MSRDGTGAFRLGPALRLAQMSQPSNCHGLSRRCAVTYRDGSQPSSNRSSNRVSRIIVVLVKSALAARKAG